MPDVRALRGALDRRLALVPGDDVAAFRAGLLVIAVAVFDNAFVSTEAGTTAGDHLASGLVPLAVAGLLIAFAPRICARLRGWIALFTGALAITAGVADHGGTAVAAALAGAALIVLGIVTLWRTRTTGGSLGARILRRLPAGVAVLAFVLLVVMPVGIALVATHKARAPVVTADLGRPYRDVALTTSDGLRLRAWYVPSRNGAAIIAFPGRAQPVPHARLLVRHGYGVLLLDRRGEGASEGGAGQRSLAEHLGNPELGRVQRWITGMVAQTVAVAVLSNSAPPADLADLMPRIAPRPTLLIQATHGNVDEVLNEVYAARGGPSSHRWLVARGGHTDALSAVPAEYERRVVGFLDRALLGPP